jgi:transcription antitermination factor NusG
MNLLKELDLINQEVKIDLTGLNIIELEKVIYDANFLIRRKRIEQFKENQQKAESNLKVGDIVSVTGTKFKGEIFEVLKLNPKKVKCKRENGETWNIPYAHIILE